MKSVGLINETAYFGILYGGNNNYPTLHLFSISIDKISFYTPYVDMSNVEYEYLPTTGDLSYEVAREIFVCVCSEGGDKRIYLYYKNNAETASQFYILKDKKTSWIFGENKVNFTGIDYTAESFIAWNNPGCYGRLQRNKGNDLQFSFR